MLSPYVNKYILCIKTYVSLNHPWKSHPQICSGQMTRSRRMTTVPVFRNKTKTKYITLSCRVYDYACFSVMDKNRYRHTDIRTFVNKFVGLEVNDRKSIPLTTVVSIERKCFWAVHIYKLMVLKSKYDISQNSWNPLYWKYKSVIHLIISNILSHCCVKFWQPLASSNHVLLTCCQENPSIALWLDILVPLQFIQANHH